MPPISRPFAPYSDGVTTETTRGEPHQLIGWAFVAAQAVLLVALVVLPAGDAWPTPAWLEWTGQGLVLLGLAVGAVAALRLGSSLTPTPVPRAAGSLTTDGLYGLVRHPIYTAVLVIVVGLVVGSGSVGRLAVGTATVVFFNAKAAWEERRLIERYPDYLAYAARTPRFVPGRRAVSRNR